MQIKMEKADSQEKSLKEKCRLSTSKDNTLDQQKETNSNWLWKCLNPNASMSLKMEDMSAAKVKAGLLLPCIDQCKSMDSSEKNQSVKLKNNIMLNVGSTSCDRTALKSLKEASSSHSNSSKRPRLADGTPASSAQLLNRNHAEAPLELEQPLKRYSREELERIIMGHMVGYVSTYKPYADIEQELDSCKKKIDNLQQKNYSLTKEVVDLRNIVKSFVTKDAKNYIRPIKQLRSVGVQVNPSVNINDVKLEKSDNFQAYSCVVKCEKLKYSRNDILTNDPRMPRNVDEYDSTSSSSSVSTPVKKREDSRGKVVSQQAMTSEAIKIKEDDDDLMVMFDKSTDFNSDVSLNQNQLLLEPIPPKPIVTVTKTTDNSTSALRISWKFPENSKHAKVASCRAFMLSGYKNPLVNDKDWIPVSGNISRMSCIIPLGRRDKLRNRYLFRVMATDIHGREGPYSDVAHADFP